MEDCRNLAKFLVKAKLLLRSVYVQVSCDEKLYD